MNDEKEIVKAVFYRDNMNVWNLLSLHKTLRGADDAIASIQDPDRTDNDQIYEIRDIVINE